MRAFHNAAGAVGIAVVDLRRAGGSCACAVLEGRIAKIVSGIAALTVIVGKIPGDVGAGAGDRIPGIGGAFRHAEGAIDIGGIDAVLHLQVRRYGSIAAEDRSAAAANGISVGILEEHTVIRIVTDGDGQGHIVYTFRRRLCRRVKNGQEGNKHHQHQRKCRCAVEEAACFHHFVSSKEFM